MNLITHNFKLSLRTLSKSRDYLKCFSKYRVSNKSVNPRTKTNRTFSKSRDYLECFSKSRVDNTFVNPRTKTNSAFELLSSYIDCKNQKQLLKIKKSKIVTAQWFCVTLFAFIVTAHALVVTLFALVMLRALMCCAVL